MKKRKHISLFDAAVWLILIISAASCLFPILNTVAISFSDKTSALTGKVGLIPKNFTLAAYEALVQETQFFRSFLNSVVRVILGTAINMFLSVMMAYPLSKDKTAFPSRNIYMWIVVFTMLFSGGLIPYYLVVSGLHLSNTIWAMIIPSAVNTFYLIIMKNYFSSLSPSLEEAAKIDGANDIQILFRVMLPISLPFIATFVLFYSVERWNEWWNALLFINDSSLQPLQIYMRNLLVNYNNQMSQQAMLILGDKRSANFQAVQMASIVVSTVPILCIYPFVQKHFVKGVMVGSVKE